MVPDIPEKEIPDRKRSRVRATLGRLLAMAPVKILLIYSVFGILWIVFSNQLLLLPPVPQEEIIMISPIRGTIFILVTALLLFLLILYFAWQWLAKNEELRIANVQLRAREEELRVQNQALAQSQSEWEATYNAISDWISLITPDGRILRTNRSVQSLLGVAPEAVIGMHCHELIHGGSCPTDSCPRRRMLVSKKRESLEIRNRQGNGWLQVTVDPVFDTAGNVVSAVHLVRDVTQRLQEQKALEQAKKKLHLLNYVTFNEIQNSVFTLWGFQQFVKERIKDPSVQPVFAKEEELLNKISHSLKFTQTYQNLGLKPPAWQEVNRVFLLAISHLDFLSIKHTVRLDGLEIFADPLLEQVLMILAENTLVHGKNVTEVSLRYSRGPASVTIIFEDNGIGIPEKIKGDIFSPDFQKTKAIGLYLAREILEITDITIAETGTPGSGARFEITVPDGAYRFPDGM